jgi:hypothetical protein
MILNPARKYIGICKVLSVKYYQNRFIKFAPRFFRQMEKCRDVTQGYATKQECDKWPQQVCELTKKNVKKYSPETQVKRQSSVFLTLT